MYASFGIWIAVVAAGVGGCLGLWVILYLTKRVPFAMLAGKPGKHLWSVIYMIPVPAILAVGGLAGWLLAFIWLTVAPSVGLKYYFGPKRLPWADVLTSNAMFAVIALVTYRLMLMIV
ncbi:hypothetical protein FQ775_22430 [Nitratireductor mangrovi]|uniref:DUF1761 domain-containing protein n=1 Tax=Nitratireductor mangrovi TaxID=2599600 RepID=A0A5B8L511_9HYPH|nr:hypothetical protein [Nitratireductor mangrovi]QDZ02899.1 hypothetical protein FQ775_22430 [Nitratireductor mangrovi]